jgi:hypothetical protein
VPEATLDADEAEEVARVVGHLLDGDGDDLLARLDATGWWDVWEVAPAACAQLFFATEGRRGTCSPAMAGFVLRLLGVDDARPDDGVVIGVDPHGTAGAVRDGVAAVRGVLLGSRPARLTGVMRSGPDGAVVVRFASGGSLARQPIGGWASPLELVSGDVEVEEVAGAAERWAETWRFVRRAWATQLVGMAETHLAAAAEHCRGREQFGRPIASFQAVKHHLARVKVAIEAARPVVAAAWASDREVDTVVAKALAGSAYLEAHNRGIHVMGGMGYSREHPIGRYHATGLALEALGGSSRVNHQALAALAGATPSVLRTPMEAE